MENFNEEYLNARFEAFLEKEGIDKKSLSKTAYNVFQKGYKYLFVTTLPADEGGVLE